MTAATAATGWPLKTTFVRAIRPSRRYFRSVPSSPRVILRSPLSLSVSGRSMPVMTARTPGYAAAALVSTDRMLAWAYGVLSIFP